MVRAGTGRRTLAPFLALALGACAAPAPLWPASYAIDGVEYRTRVDSELAQYLVERDRRARRPALDRRIDALLDDAGLADDPQRLRELAERTSIDFATALFRAQIGRLPANRRLRERVAAAEDASIATVPAGYRIALVPGWRYRSNPSNGADLRRVRDAAHALGLECATVPIEEDGTIEENADRIVAWLAHVPPDGRLVLVSASKGGAEVALALDRVRGLPAADAVSLWINVSGLVGGSPLADEARGFPERVFIGLALRLARGSDRPVASMQSAVRRAVRASLLLPEHVTVINYVGAPYSGDISAHAATLRWWLGGAGPNDGIGLLPDALMPGAPTLIEPGVDHFFDAPSVDARIAAVLSTAIGMAEEKRVAMARAAAASGLRAWSMR